LSYSSAEDPVQGSGALRAAAAAQPLEEGPAGNGRSSADGTGRSGADGAHAAAQREVVNVPVRVEKTPGRNEPCYCGSGKKYKLCHGR
jgi:preprotein translocase subunit SecA